jgi:hypothetical protein
MHAKATRLGALDWAERTRLPEAAALRFAPVIGQVDRYEQFLRIVFDRYQRLVVEHQESIGQIQAFMSSHGGEPRQLTADEMVILARQSELSARVHLEVETFYLFAKIFLDKSAHFLEHCFGTVRKLSLHSHDQLVKRLDAYVAAIGIRVPPELSRELQSLKQRISDFRDYQIAHEQSPYMARGTLFGLGQEPRIVLMKIPPAGSPPVTQPHAQSEAIQELMIAIDCHIGRLIDLYEANRGLSVFLRSPSKFDEPRP